MTGTVACLQAEGLHDVAPLFRAHTGAESVRGRDPGSGKAADECFAHLAGPDKADAMGEELWCVVFVALVIVVSALDVVDALCVEVDDDARYNR